MPCLLHLLVHVVHLIHTLLKFLLKESGCSDFVLAVSILKLVLLVELNLGLVAPLGEGLDRQQAPPLLLDRLEAQGYQLVHAD